jgi:hypothetical protein
MRLHPWSLELGAMSQPFGLRGAAAYADRSHSQATGACQGDVAVVTRVWQRQTFERKHVYNHPCVILGELSLHAAAPVLIPHSYSLMPVWKELCIPGVANALGVVILLILRNQRACIRSKDWRCRARVTPARSPWRAHVACIPRLRQRQSFSRMLLSQKSKTSRITSPRT